MEISSRMRYAAGRNAQPVISRAPLGEEITTEKSVKDLGVVVDDSLTFSLQIAAAVRKAKRQMGWALRVFRTKDPAPMMTIQINHLVSSGICVPAVVTCKCERYKKVGICTTNVYSAARWNE